VTVGKKVGGFVLHVAARVVSKHSLNVMAGHDDVYALLSSGYTILFGSNPQEAADLAAISYRVSADSLIPVANAMDGFATSHMLSEAHVPEDELLREFLGDPSGRIKRRQSRRKSCLAPKAACSSCVNISRVTHVTFKLTTWLRSMRILKPMQGPSKPTALVWVLAKP
jgi:pyruvate/2-oxoacid:ferredoxin oxidoreductase alpha subunit